MNGYLCQHGYGIGEQILSVVEKANAAGCARHGYHYNASRQPIPPSHRWGGGVRFELLRVGLEMVKWGAPCNYFDSDALWWDTHIPLCPWGVDHLGMTAITNRQMGITDGWQAGVIYTQKTPETIKVVDWMIDFYRKLGEKDIEAEKVFVSPEFPYREYLAKIPARWNLWEYGATASDPTLTPVSSREPSKGRPIVVAAHGMLWKSKLNVLAALLEVSAHA